MRAAMDMLAANRHSRHLVEDPPGWERRFAGYLGLGLGLSLLAAPPISGQCLYEATIIQGPMCTDGLPATFGPSDLDEQGNVAGGSSCFLAAHATIWTGPGTAQLLPDCGESWVQGMTDPDHIVGVDFQGGGAIQLAAFWEFGNLILLGTLPGDEISEARGINQSNQIIGLSSGVGSGGSFLWENGEFSTLSGFPDGAVAIANDTNGEGQIVGYMGDSIFTANAYLWENGIVTDLGKIPGGTSRPLSNSSACQYPASSSRSTIDIDSNIMVVAKNHIPNRAN